MEFCKRESYNVVGKYIDRATSAFKDTDKRTEFNKMIKDSEKGLWQGIIVYKLDRFARNRYDSATFKARLKKNGVKVISATENISDNPEGVILEAVLEGMAEFYSKELSQKITRGMRESAYKCHSIGGHIPLGYKIVDKKLTIDEPNAQIVREAFDLYANGATVAEICDKFNRAGYRTAKGAAFNKNSFKAMFRNERYIGIYTYKDVRIEGGVPAIIDKETFETVRSRLSVNAEAPSRGKAKVDYLLAQKLFCGHCGATMTGESGTSKTGDVHNYYTCGTRKRFHTCDKKPLRKEFIERVVAEDAMAFLTPDKIELLADMAIKQNQEDFMLLSLRFVLDFRETRNRGKQGQETRQGCRRADRRPIYFRQNSGSADSGNRRLCYGFQRTDSRRLDPLFEFLLVHCYTPFVCLFI
jgi:DNA invertase Pin-like site-specific DNA recombinase